MNILARFSLLSVALFVSAFSLGHSLSLADELPKDTNKIESLTPEQARKLVKEFPGVDVEFEFAGAGKRQIARCLPMNGLKLLDPDAARALADYGKGPLLLNGLTTLDTATARALADFKGSWLFLNGLTTLDPHAAKALASFKGHVLFLSGLPALDTDSAKMLAEFKGGRLMLNGMITLDADTATALASNVKWDGQLPGLTTLDSPDSIAVARSLAARKGRLALPSLKRISPKTLSALIAKEDVEIPRVETLQLIPEPDGSATDDFVIPEWLEKRQKQKSGVQTAE
jgi:hypothetical protein